MSHFVMTNCQVYVNEHDLTTDHNEVAINYGAELVDGTAFGVTATRTRYGGFKTLVIDGHGWWESRAGQNSMYLPDKLYFDKVGVVDTIITLCPTGGASGERGYSCKQMIGSYNPLTGKIGEMAGFNIHCETTSEGLIRGSMLLGKATKTSSDNGTAYQLGAVTASQTVYGILHVFSASAADTLDVVVASDSVEAFTGSPETQLTFTQVSGATETSEWKSKAGAIADTWWRVQWTIAGADPSFSFAVCVGIV